MKVCQIVARFTGEWQLHMGVEREIPANTWVSDGSREVDTSPNSHAPGGRGQECANKLPRFYSILHNISMWHTIYTSLT